MYYVSKTMEIAGAHSLKLSYPSKCQRLHGHNWIITVYCKAKELNKDGMVCDFKHIKDKIHGYLDQAAVFLPEFPDGGGFPDLPGPIYQKRFAVRV